MRLICPSCQATYDVPDAILAGGPREVKCARCANTWTASTEPPVPPMPPSDAPHEAEDAPLPPPPPPPPVEAAGPMAALEADANGRSEPRLNPLHPRMKPRPQPPTIDSEPPAHLGAQKAGAGAIAAWVLSLLLLIGAGGAAVNWRVQVMAAWPPSERVFAAVGLR